MSDQSSEVPWFSEPPEAKIARLGCENDDVIYGYIHFYDPKGERAAIPVTLGEKTHLVVAGSPGSPIWHIEGELSPGGTATVSPSIHFIRHWHSPNPVQFRIVQELSPPEE